jgi:hypothetical protein
MFQVGRSRIDGRPLELIVDETNSSAGHCVTGLRNRQRTQVAQRLYAMQPRRRPSKFARIIAP